MNITLDKKEEINLTHWKEEHRKSCPYLSSDEEKIEEVEDKLDGKITGEVFYAFGGGVGTRVLAKCRCGEEGDITDYSSW